MASRTLKVAALSFGKALTGLVAVVSAAVLARILTKVEYGTYRQTMLAYAFAAPLLTLSLPQALYYFLPGEKQRKRGMLWDNLILLFMMGILFGIFLLFGGNRLLAWRFQNPDLVDTLRIIAPYPFFMMPIGAVGACLVIQNRVNSLAVFNILSRLFMVVGIILSCLIWRNVTAPLIANTITAGIVLPFGIWLMVRAIPEDNPSPSLSTMGAMLRYSVPLGLSSMIGTISIQLDKMIVASMCSTEDFAIYTNGAMEIPMVAIITGSIASVILADMREMIEDGKNQDALRLFNLAAVRSGSFLLPIMVYLLVVAEPFMTMVWSEKYAQSAYPFRFYLLLVPARLVFYGSALMAFGKTRIVLYRSIVSLVLNLILSILFVRIFGYIGAIIATILTIYIWSVIFNLLVLAKSWECRIRDVIPFREIGQILLISSIPALPTWFVMRAVEHLSPFIIVPVTALVYGAIFLPIMLFFGFLDIRQLLKFAKRS
jgi:O-antigen/teichoic acid export membrane protein